MFFICPEKVFKEEGNKNKEGNSEQSIGVTTYSRKRSRC